MTKVHLSSALFGEIPVGQVFFAFDSWWVKIHGGVSAKDIKTNSLYFFKNTDKVIYSRLGDK